MIKTDSRPDPLESGASYSKKKSKNGGKLKLMKNHRGEKTIR